jgi:hypothetical protein
MTQRNCTLKKRRPNPPLVPLEHPLHFRLLIHPMSSHPPALSDNPYDNYIKEKPAPAAAVQPTRERCANVYAHISPSMFCFNIALRYDTLMTCLMKSKVPLSSQTKL